MTAQFRGKTYWIVGASEGLGAEIARQLNRLGARLVLSARSEEKLVRLTGEFDDAKAVPIDVTDNASVTAAINAAGDVHGVIYCVGQYVPMRTDAWDLPQSMAVIDANYLGAVRLFSGVAPALFRRGTGHIVIIGSLAGFHGLPGAIGYSSSKGAVMQLCENMFMDAKGTDVKVQQINPGFIQTRLTEKNAFNMPSIMTLQDAATRVVNAMKGKRFRTNFPRPFAWLFTLGRLLPSRLFRRLFY